MRLFGLIGNPVAHSQSPDYFQQLWTKKGITDCRYLLFSMENLNELPRLLRQYPGLQGLNVTSPFKESVLDYADAADECALRLRSANVLLLRQGKITAFNTDHLGFDRLLEKCPKLSGAALICGTGGAARAVCLSLERHGIQQTVLSRTSGPDRLQYAMLDGKMLQNYRFIINATPLGMGNFRTECPPLPYEAISSSHILIDLIYNPSETIFLKKGKAAGCFCLNGLPMLHAQADEAWKIWQRY